MRDIEIEKLYTINETAELLGLSRMSVYNLINGNKLKTVPFGKVKRIKEREIIRILNGEQK